MVIGSRNSWVKSCLLYTPTLISLGDILVSTSRRVIVTNRSLIVIRNDAATYGKS